MDDATASAQEEKRQIEEQKRKLRGRDMKRRSN